MEQGDGKKRMPRGKAQLIPDKCIACGDRCQQACPTHAIAMNVRGEPVIDTEECTGCRKCAKICPSFALEMTVPASVLAPGEEASPAASPQPQAGGKTPGDQSRGVWVFVEQAVGVPHPVSWELSAAGRTLANDLGVELRIRAGREPGATQREGVRLRGGPGVRGRRPHWRVIARSRISRPP